MSTQKFSRPNYHCWHCKQQPDSNDGQLKRCSRCRIIRYCSNACQTSDWPRHKRKCRKIADLSLRTPRHTDEDADPDEIYYLRSSKPHLREISISGPFHPANKVLEQIFNRMVQEKVTPEAMIDHLVQGGIAQSIKVPLPGGLSMTFQVIPEKNPPISRILPCTVWYVSVMIPDIEYVREHGRDSPEIPMEANEVHGTFLTMEAAKCAADELLEEVRAEAGGNARIESFSNDQFAARFVVPIRKGQNPTLVEVRCADCESRPVDRFGNLLPE